MTRCDLCGEPLGDRAEPGDLCPCCAEDGVTEIGPPESARLEPRMSAEIAAILTAHRGYEYQEGVFPNGPWAGWGHVCSCGIVLGTPEIPMVAGVSWIDQVHALHVAEEISQSLAEHDRQVADRAWREAQYDYEMGDVIPGNTTLVDRYARSPYAAPDSLRDEHAHGGDEHAHEHAPIHSHPETEAPLG